MSLKAKAVITSTDSMRPDINEYAKLCPGDTYCSGTITEAGWQIVSLCVPNIHDAVAKLKCAAKISMKA